MGSKPIERILSIQRSLNEILRDVHTPQQVLRPILRTAMEIAGADLGGVYFVSKDDSGMDLVFSEGIPAELIPNVRHYGRDSANAAFVRGGRPVYNVPHADFCKILDIPGSLGNLSGQLQSLAVIPILHKGQAIACINLGAKEPEHFSPAIQDALESVASHFGSIIARFEAEQGKQIIEERLSDSEAQLRNVLALSPACIYRGGSTHPYPIRYMTENTKACCGHAPERILQDNDWRLNNIHPDDLPGFLESAGRVEENGAVEAEYRMRNGEGSWCWMRDRMSLHKAETGQGEIIGSLMDISNQIQTAETLRHREETLHLLGHATEKFLRVADWESYIRSVLKQIGEAVDADRVFIFENHSRADGVLLSSLRYEWAAPGIDPQIDQPYNKELDVRSVAALAERLAQNEPVAGGVGDFGPTMDRFLALHKVFSFLLVPIFVDESFWGCIGFNACRSARAWAPPEIDALQLVASTIGAAIRHNRDKRALEVSEKRYRAIIDDQIEFVCRFLPDFTLTFVNEALCKAVRVSPDQLLGQNIAAFLPEPHLEKVRDSLKKITPQNPVADNTSVDVYADGKTRCIRWLNRGIFNGGGKVVEYQGVGRDITDFVQAREALERAHEELEKKVLERTKLLDEANQALKQELLARKNTEKMLKQREQELQNRTQKLEELNIALQTFIEYRDKDKVHIEENILSNVRELVMPWVEKLKKSISDDSSKLYVDMVESNLQEIVSPFARGLAQKYPQLTPTEIQVINMIREGKSSKAVAEILRVSVGTIHFHRNNIRVKLGLKKNKVNMRSFLLSFS